MPVCGEESVASGMIYFFFSRCLSCCDRCWNGRVGAPALLPRSTDVSREQNRDSGVFSSLCVEAQYTNC